MAATSLKSQPLNTRGASVAITYKTLSALRSQMVYWAKRASEVTRDGLRSGMA